MRAKSEGCIPASCLATRSYSGSARAGGRDRHERRRLAEVGLGRRVLGHVATIVMPDKRQRRACRAVVRVAASRPCRSILNLQRDDQLLDGHRELIGVPVRPPAAVRQPLHTAVLEVRKTSTLVVDWTLQSSRRRQILSMRSLCATESHLVGSISCVRETDSGPRVHSRQFALARIAATRNAARPGAWPSIPAEKRSSVS